MPTWPAALGQGWQGWRVGVEAATRAQSDQDRGADLGQTQAEGAGIVAASNTNSGTARSLADSRCTRARIWVTAAWLWLSSGCSLAASTGAVQLSRTKPSWLIHWSAHPATIGRPAEWREG